MTLQESFQRISIAMRMGDFSQAEKLLTQLVREKPDLVQALILLGSLYSQTGRFDAAKKLLLRAGKLDRDNGEVFNNLGVLYKNTGEYRRAVASLNKALQLFGNRADVRYNLGNVYKDMGRPAEAMREYLAAIGLDPSFAPTYVNLGSVYEAQGDYENAIAIYQKGLESDTNNPKLRYNLGTIYQSQNQLAKAREQFLHVLKSQPGWTDAMNNLGVVIHELGEHESAVYLFQEILKKEPENTKALNNLGVTLSTLERRDQAEEAYRRAVALDPTYAVARQNLAGILEEKGRPAAARKEYAKILQDDPKDVEARYGLAKTYLAQDQYDKAIQHLKGVLGCQKDHPGALQQLGGIYLRMNDTAKARSCFHRLQQVNPDSPQFELENARVWKEKKEYGKAVEAVKKHLASNPQDHRAKLLLGELLGILGDGSEAIRVLTEAAEQEPESVETYYQLSKIHRETGNIGEAIAAAEKLITVQGSRANKDDLDQLRSSLELYEGMVHDYEKDAGETWLRSLRKLAGIEEEPQPEAAEEEVFVLDGQEQLEEDSIPIIDIGGLEPILTVEEEAETIHLEEEEEEETINVDVSSDGMIPFLNLVDEPEQRDRAQPPLRYPQPPMGQQPYSPPPMPPSQSGAPAGPASASPSPASGAPAAEGRPSEPFEIPPLRQGDRQAQKPPSPAEEKPPTVIVVPTTQIPSDAGARQPMIIQSPPTAIPPVQASQEFASLRGSLNAQQYMLEKMQKDIEDLSDQLLRTDDEDEETAVFESFEEELPAEPPESSEPLRSETAGSETAGSDPVHPEEPFPIEPVGPSAEVLEQAAAPEDRRFPLGPETPELEIFEEEPELVDEMLEDEPEIDLPLFDEEPEILEEAAEEELPETAAKHLLEQLSRQMPTAEKPGVKTPPPEPAGEMPAAESSEPERKPPQKTILDDKEKTAGLLDYLVKLTDALPENTHQSFLRSSVRSKTELLIKALASSASE